MQSIEAGVSWQKGCWPSVRAGDTSALSIAELESLVAAQKEHNRTLASDDELHEFFHSLDAEALTAFASRLQGRIVQETEVLERFARLGLDPFAPDLLSLPLPCPVQVVPVDEAPEVLGGAQACYRDGTIMLAGDLPDLATRLTALATRGVVANDLFHEVFHSLQDGGAEFYSLADVLDSVTALAEGISDHKTALAEAHAWLASLPGFRHDLIANVVSGCYQLDGEALRVAIDLVYGLGALGLDDAEIGRLVAQATWNPDQGHYLELAAERERLLARNGWSSDDLAAAVARRHLLERLQVVRSIGIAREMARELWEAPAPAEDPAPAVG